MGNHCTKYEHPRSKNEREERTKLQPADTYIDLLEIDSKVISLFQDIRCFLRTLANTMPNMNILQQNMKDEFRLRFKNI